MYDIKYFSLKILILTNSFKGINQYNYGRKLMHHPNSLPVSLLDQVWFFNHRQ